MRLRTQLVSVAALVLAACATHKPTRTPAPHTQPPAPAVPAAPATQPPAAPKPAVKKARPAEIVQKPAKQEALSRRDVGYYFDVLQGRLQQQLDPAVIIARDSASIVLDFSRRLGFAGDAVQLDEADHAVLAPLAKILVEYRAVLVSVRASAEDDSMVARKLAQQRADAVARVLTDAGVVDARIVGIVPKAVARDGTAHVEIALVPETRND